MLHARPDIKRNSGDYSTKVPPLPIPNREVKLRHADGTAYCGRVGSLYTLDFLCTKVADEQRKTFCLKIDVSTVKNLHE